MFSFYTLVDFLWSFFVALVFVSVVEFAYTIAKEGYALFFGGLSMKKRLKKYGQWAVVTGCTRGMGVDYCRQLAELGIDLIMIARNKALLQKQAEKLESEYNIKTCTIVSDFNDVREENFKNVFQSLDDKDIGILINNAGVMYEYPEYFYNISEEVLTQLSNINVVWPLRLSHYVAREKMIKKQKGLIVFISSAVGIRETPLLTAYGASKAFIYYLAKCLNMECKGQGVHVQVISPFYVATDMTKYSEMLNKPSFLSPSSETYVKQSLKTFGMTSDTAGYLPHAVQGALFDMLPKRLYTIGAIFWQKSLKIKRAS